jgi:phosphoribosylglycinamide formyltransferase-1
VTRIAIFISGRGSNMAAILREAAGGILADCCRVVLVFSNDPHAPGLSLASAAEVPILCLPPAGLSKPAFYQRLAARLAPYFLDYLVLAGYMSILPPTFVDLYAGRIINIHPADTARHHGLHAYRWAFEQRLPQTMITVHYVDAGVDTGPVIMQAPVDLRGTVSLEEVERRGLPVEHAVYSRALRAVFSGAAQA